MIRGLRLNALAAADGAATGPIEPRDLIELERRLQPALRPDLLS